MAEPSVPAPLVAVSTGATPGRTVIENSVVSKIVGMAARDVPGVHALGGGAARMIGALRDAMNSADLSQGVRVEVGETQVAVDVSLVADYPFRSRRSPTTSAPRWWRRCRPSSAWRSRK